MADNRLPPRRKTTIEIPLHSIHKYVPGSGPPPPRISLAPPRDSTAYIIDQFVLPTDKDMTETSRRLIHYHIGFTDLPAVKILIPCNKVLDYVSPRELEEWEYENLERKEEDRARRLAEKQRADATKRKPGRPPKVPMKDVDLPVRSSADEALLLAQQVAGPSLSTPQKRRPALVLDEEGMGDTSNVESDDAAIHRQLQGNPEFGESEFDDDPDADSESVDQLALHYGATVEGTPSRTSSSVPPSLPPQQDSTITTSIALKTKTGFSSSAPAPALPPSNTSTPGGIHPAWAQAFGQQKRAESPAKPHSQNGHVQQNGTPWSLLAKPQPKPSTSTPTQRPAARAGGTSNGPASRLSTPGVGVGSSIASGSSASKRKGQPLNGKGSSQEKQPKTKKQKNKQAPDEPAADEWAVKELLDDRWFIEQGAKVHRYLVLWEGDWPEDQNPTWEPSENVQNQALIQRYQKKKKAGLLNPSKKTQKTLHQYLAGSAYSSVAEAFEGDIDEQTGPVAADIGSEADRPETFLVTENVGAIMTNGANPARAPSFGSFDSMLSRYNQTFAQR
ncbi:hypothetical protein C8A00DRAFT_38409 [Chaetomidium leptoderma]|uniref:Chromo domain-containing protein n=1 Tax=Chaetomidium leptoderma TaxID=669021 RepID=A0AAN6VCR5_9PEZI|nr:hypothetical protein C8A00DRAFT_38409 [Chaetomidium leptoderma]